MKIAIIDFINQDIGPKILFPEADYFVFECEFNRDSSYQMYGFKPRIIDFQTKSILNDSKYDVLFVIISVLGELSHSKGVDRFNLFADILKSNNFKKIILFDNYDYDYDPSTIIPSDIKFDLIFKRNYQKTKTYKPNVHPFPFIMFGYFSMIERLDQKIINPKTINQVFFSGSIFNHIDDKYKIYRDRNIFHEIKHYVADYRGSLSHPHYMDLMSRHRFSLDLDGVGDPSKRTFEIISAGSLRIAQRNNLKWPFDDDFCEETYFSTATEFIEKLKLLQSDDKLYEKCLNQQNMIYDKYLNKKWIRNYVEKMMNEQ